MNNHDGEESIFCNSLAFVHSSNIHVRTDNVQMVNLSLGQKVNRLVDI